MKPIDSTHEILALKHLQRDVGERWVNWAVEMMGNGFETEHLVELAGIERPYNQFELYDLTNKVFKELGLDYGNQNRVITDYVTYLAQEVVEGNRELYQTIEYLKDLCVELDYYDRLMDFYHLYFARDELAYSKVQLYWNGANRKNIDQVCLNCFKDWIKDHGPL